MVDMETFEMRHAKIISALADPKVLESMSDTEKKSILEWLDHLKYNWEFNSRPNQKMPTGTWTTWLILAGRGFGKTRTGAEAIRQLVNSGKYRAIGLIAPTASDARDTMIDGKGGSSLLEISRDAEKLEYFPTKRRLTWGNGAQGSSFSAEEPERLRGPQHDAIWSDELAAWRYLQETWDMAMFGLRLGKILSTSSRPPLDLFQSCVK